MNKNITKNELIEMIQVKEEEIEKLKGEVERLAKYEKYDEMADELYAMYESLKRSGFDDQMAFELFKTMVQTASVMNNTSNPGIKNNAYGGLFK